MKLITSKNSTIISKMQQSSGNQSPSDGDGGKPRISVCVVATHPIVLSALQKALDASSFETFPNKLRFGSTLSEQVVLPTASIYVIDSTGIPSGSVEIVRQIVGRTLNAHIVVLAENFDEESAFPLLNLGVKGLIAHEFMDQQLVRALQAVATGGFWVPRVLLSRFVDSVITKNAERKTVRPARIEVSRREREILDSLLLNLANKEIASRLNISERTVKFHVSNLLIKFNVQRRADLILLCYQSAQSFAEHSSLPTPQISWRPN